MNGMDNLRFDKEGYLHVLLFCGLFYKRNRKYQFFPCFFTCESLSELQIAWKHVPTAISHVPTAISRSPKLPLVFPLLLWSAYL